MTDYMVIGKFRNREKVQNLVEAIRSKGKTCYSFADNPAFPDMLDSSPEDQMNALGSQFSTSFIKIQKSF
jgi:hypothetical protein